MLFDSHAHYDDEVFDDDRDIVIKELKQNGIIGVLNCGSSVEGAKSSVELANKYDYFYAAVGVHPGHAYEFNDEVLNEIEKLAQSNNKVKAIGEIGLDYYYKDGPLKEVQKDVFRKQMGLAEKLGLPVVIHDREAHEDTLNILKEFPNVNGVVHCFSGSVEFAQECLKIGYYLGFTGVVTFKNAKKPLEVLKNVPMNRILVETDCPYLAPVPYRGKRNRSEYINEIVSVISDVKGIPVKTVKYETIKNTNDLLKIG